MLLEKFKTQLEIILKKSIKKIIVKEFELILEVKKEKIPFILNFLKNNSYSQFKILTDIIVIDEPSDAERFTIVYHLLSIKYSVRLSVKTKINNLSLIQSVQPIFNSANWMEREVWDLFGIFFKNHPDLRRLLTDYGFKGHPLRKDFPLSGFTELRYDDNFSKIVTEPLELPQAYRNFNFRNPWIKNKC